MMEPGMNEFRTEARRFWESSLTFYLMIGAGLLVLIGLFLGRDLLPDGQDQRDARTAQMEAQAAEAKAAQERDAAARDAPRAVFRD
jgi:hypothetical protein